MPVPYAPPVTLTDEDRRQLEALARAHSTPQALAFRCRLILRTAAPDWPPNLRVAVEMHCDRHTVWEAQGQTFEDRDGYRVVHQNAAWTL